MRKKTALDYNTYGFRGTYLEVENSEKAIIVLMGDTDEDMMNKAASKWLNKVSNINALSVSLITTPGEESGVHSWPIERVESAVRFLESRNISKIGILGISMQAALCLIAASLIPEIRLVLAFAPADFVPWGFRQGKLGRYRHAEWPSGTSTFSYHGSDLPYLESAYSDEEYYQHYLDEKRKWGEIHTESFFTGSEEKFGIDEDEFIKVENIKGKLVLVGAQDDSMWTSAKYIERIGERLERNNFSYEFIPLIYEFGTHLLMPERMLKCALPVGGSLVYRMYNSGKKNASECKVSRLDLDVKLPAILKAW